MTRKQLRQSHEQAAEHLRGGRLPEAERLYRQVVAETPDDADALHMLGVIYLQRGRADQAAASLSQAISFRPDDPALRVNFACALETLGQFREALVAARKAVELDPDLPQAQFALANLLARTDQGAASLDIYRKLLDQQPNDLRVLVNFGSALMSAGQTQDAVDIFQRAAAAHPDNAQVQYNLGMIQIQQQRFDEAAALLQRAIDLNPNFLEAMQNLAIYHQRNERFPQAQVLWEKILVLHPDHLEALYTLGVLLRQTGQAEKSGELLQRAVELQPKSAALHLSLSATRKAQNRIPGALASAMRAVECDPNSAPAHFAMGTLLEQTENLAGAIQAYRRCLELRPDDVPALVNLSATYKSQGQYQEALDHLNRAAQMEPNNARVQYNLGTTFLDLNRNDEAIAAFERAVSLNDKFADAFNNLGTALLNANRPAEALAPLNRAVELDPDSATTFNNLGEIFKDFGDLAKACECFQRAMGLAPTDASFASNLIFAMHYRSGTTASDIREQQRKFDDTFGQVARLEIDSSIDRSPDRRLRIGYVSPDLYSHVVGWNLLPVMEHHNHAKVEIYGYSSALHADDYTARIRSKADVWRDVARSSDDELADWVHQDRIDVLVDLSLHSGKNRLRAFAKKTAPVQLSYLGYCGGVGMKCIDYRLSDPFLDNKDTEGNYRERTLYLPDTYWCYHPKGTTPPPTRIGDTNTITFGCLNNFAKVSQSARELFAAILREVKDSRLILQIKPGPHVQALLDRFAGWGVDPGRIEIVSMQAYEQYMETYRRIDISLDPFPFNGGITTCDALWMGTPVVTLAGETSVGRAGKSILSNVGMSDWVAENANQYRSLAVTAAGDRHRLSEIRQELRARMERSPLMDSAKFTAGLESVFRTAWQSWCESRIS